MGSHIIVTTDSGEIIQEDIKGYSRDELAQHVAGALMKPHSVLTLNAVNNVVLIPVHTVRYVVIEDEATPRYVITKDDVT